MTVKISFYCLDCARIVKFTKRGSGRVVGSGLLVSLVEWKGNDMSNSFYFTNGKITLC